MIVVDYAYYTTNYGGFLIPEDKFAYYEGKAAAYVDAVTFGRVDKTNIPTEVKNAVCDAAECCFRASESKAVSEGISSEKVGDYQVSYSGGASAAAGAATAMSAAVKYRLGNTGLLYRGDE